MIEITKEITFEEILEKIEEAKNIGICGLVFALCALVILVLVICLFFEYDKINDDKFVKLEKELKEEQEKIETLSYQVRFYCNSVTYLDSSNIKKGKKK